ncbi:MAG: YybS family protein [Desulfobacterales bacterium]|nr:MAG: YybS family protein [Desulfobacterales bacterium]
MTHIAHGKTYKDVMVAIAVTTLISMAALHFTVLGPFVGLFIPLPILFYRSKLGRSSGLLILTTVSLFVTAFVGLKSIGTAAFLFEVGLVGLILPEVFEMNLSVEKTVGITAGGVLTTGTVILALYTLLSTTSPWAVAASYLEKSAKLALAMYREMDVPEEKVNMLAQSLDGILYIMLRIIPAVMIVATLFVVWSNLLLARFVLRSKELFCPDFGRLNQWKAPEHLVWVAIASGVLLLFGHPGLKIIGINGVIVMMMIYFFQGIAIVSFYFEKKQFPRLLRVLLYGLIAVQQPLLLVVVAVGFFDIWIDFRRTRKVES